MEQVFAQTTSLSDSLLRHFGLMLHKATEPLLQRICKGLNADPKEMRLEMEHSYMRVAESPSVRNRAMLVFRVEMPVTLRGLAANNHARVVHVFTDDRQVLVALVMTSESGLRWTPVGVPWELPLGEDLTTGAYRLVRLLTASSDAFLKEIGIQPN